MTKEQDRRLLGRLLKEWREAAGLTQEGFADELGCSRSQIGDYERGRSVPSMKTLWRFISAIERVYAVDFGPDLLIRLVSFYLGPERVGKKLIIANEVIRLGRRR